MVDVVLELSLYAGLLLLELSGYIPFQEEIHVPRKMLLAPENTHSLVQPKIESTEPGDHRLDQFVKDQVNSLRREYEFGQVA